MENSKVITILDNENFLRQVSFDIDFGDKGLENDISYIEEFCIKNDVLAMSAIQIGIPKRLIYLKNTNLDILKKIQTDSKTDENEKYNEARIFINPIITSKEGLTEYWESCASCPDKICHVMRPYSLNVEYYDKFGNKYSENLSGFETTVLAHEIDHLDGILHIDIADEILTMKKEDRKIFRQTHGYNIILKDGNFEELKLKR